MQKTLAQDNLFRCITTFGTGSALVFMVTSLITLSMGDAIGIRFQWHWTVLPAVIAVLLWNRRFWNVVWALQDAPTPALRHEIKIHCLILALGGIGAFLYPIRFVDPTRFLQVVKGLTIAAVALGIVGFFLFKCAKGLAEIDEIELRRQRDASK